MASRGLSRTFGAGGWAAPTHAAGMEFFAPRGIRRPWKRRVARISIPNGVRPVSPVGAVSAGAAGGDGCRAGAVHRPGRTVSGADYD